MAEPLGDFSKILELQEVKKHYDDLQERHSSEIADRDREIQQLRTQLADMMNQSAGEGTESDRLKEENDRLTKQVALIRQEYEAKIERLSSRVRELGGSGSRQPVAAEPAEKKGGGFFRR